jgi:hypothetical protein
VVGPVILPPVPISSFSRQKYKQFWNAPATYERINDDTGDMEFSLDDGCGKHHAAKVPVKEEIDVELEGEATRKRWEELQVLWLLELNSSETRCD